ncbi:creatininase family protein [Domibacillus sp. A3M-37]|uniref:creatininase family protein n=1 Tax=Domibacillus sp. A3M-37 TaxID=2962037 RepID=UPI0020B8A8DE|nr:creatininase family protein [Domibacillus sp. A3M-37]MCP3760944.1 creatininase family protein [Domibacillus sp. A3M-37]
MNQQNEKAWQEFFLPRLTTTDIQNLDKKKGVVVLPVGAVEQHGPHLPVYTDTLIAEGMLNRIFEHIEPEDNVWLLPPIPYGKSNEHFGKPGVMTLSAHTLGQVVLDIGKSVKASGFRRLVLFNTHGGNLDLLNMMAREIRIETGLMVFRMNVMDFKGELEDLYSKEELQYGIHGGDVETSMILALEESWVQMDKAPVEYYAYNQPVDIKGGPYAAWLIDDLSASGISGEAALATKEKGIQTIDRLSRKMAGTLQEISSFEMDSFHSKPVPSTT